MRLFASSDPIDIAVDRALVCDEHFATPVAERIFPDGAVHLIFNLGARPSGERGAELACLAMGPTLDATNIVLAGAVDQVCVRLRVGAAASVLGVPVHAIAQHGVALDTLWGSAATAALDQLAAAPRTHRVRVMQHLLRERIAPVSRVVMAALQRIAQVGGQLRVGDLAADLGLTTRRLQQLFDEHVGLSPKETCRLARFRALLAQRRRSPAAGWSELALHSGFYDQAHLVHELRAFTGLTPTQLDGFAFFQDPAAAAS